MCGSPAIVDTKTIYGHWAYLCKKCNEKYGIKQWNTPLAGLSDNGVQVYDKYVWNENIPYYNQPIYKDMRKALATNTIKITMKSGKSKLVTEGNIVALKCVINVAIMNNDYPVKWKVVEL